MVLGEHRPHGPLSAWCGLAWLLWQPCTACLWWCLSILRGRRSAAGLVREKCFKKRTKSPKWCRGGAVLVSGLSRCLPALTGQGDVVAGMRLGLAAP